MIKTSTDDNNKADFSGENEARKTNSDMQESPHSKKRRLAHLNEGIPSKRRGIEAERDPQLETQRATLTTASPGNALQEQGTICANATDNAKTQDLKGSNEEDLKSAKVPDEEKLDDRLTFPERLMYLLQHEVEPKALWWQKDGVSFGFEPKLFTEKVLNKLFPTKIKFESFIRKLNRWGFRRVPGQGLPPNGAAYKHPQFKKSDPELMKSMKFGQKVDNRRQGQLPTTSSVSSSFLTASAHLHTNRQASNNTSLLLRGAQSADQLCLLRTLTTTQMQNQQLTNQAFAIAGLTAAGSDVENHRMLLSGLHGNLPFPQMPGATSVSHQLHSLVGNNGRRLSGGSASLSTERDIRDNALLFGTSLAELQSSLSQSFNASNQLGGSTTAAATLGALSSAPGMVPSATRSGISANMFASSLGGLNTGSSNYLSNLVQGPGPNTARLPTAQFADNLSLLQQQAPASSRDAELLMLIEQERQWKQNEETKLS